MAPSKIVDEREFRPSSLEQAEQLYHALVAAEVSPGMARGVVSWLIVLPANRADDPATNATRRDYRQALAKLGEPPWGPRRLQVVSGNRDMVGYLRSAHRRAGHRFHIGSWSLASLAA